MDNPFKQRLEKQDLQVGLWLAMADPYAAGLAGHAGFDWVVLDAEHGPNDLRTILAQLQALEASPSQPVVRPPMAERWMLKQLAEIGVQNFLIPMVESAEQAKDIVASLRYPPQGVRGMGAGIARASRFNTVTDYVETADEGICIIAQVETREALRHLEEIASVEGVDGLFIGPNDLAADMGYTGNIYVDEVQRAIVNAIERARKIGKPMGILTFDRQLNEYYIGLGASLVAVGADVTSFTAALRHLASEYDRNHDSRPLQSGY